MRGVCHESTLFLAVPKPDVDFEKWKSDKNISIVYDWLGKAANVEDFLYKFICWHVKRKVSKIRLLTWGQNNNKLRHNYRKGVITTSKSLSVLTKMIKILIPPGGSYVYMSSICQNIWRLSFTNNDLPALEYGRTIEMEAANQFFELMKKKH